MSDMRDEIEKVLADTGLPETGCADALAMLFTEQLAEVRKQRDDALRLLTDKRTGSLYGGALAGWDGSPTMPGGRPAPDRVAEHLAYARRALGDPETVTGVHELRTATASVIAAVEALAGGASS